MQPRAAHRDERIGKWLLMTGTALAILQGPAAHALSLGDMQIESAIGQPLVATTTVRLGAGETLSNKCVTAPAGGGDDITRPTGIKVTTVDAMGPGEYPLRVTTRSPLYEPMYEIELQVQCAGSIALRKNYVVLLNLPVATLANQPQSSSREAQAAARPAAQPRPTLPRQPRAASRDLSSSAAPIAAGSLYRVRSGDTLSTVAERVTDRPAGSLWNVAQLLFAANPDAFVADDPDRLKLGAMLYIPEAGTLALDAPNEPAKPESRAAAAPATPAMPPAAAMPPADVSSAVPAATPVPAALAASSVDRAAAETAAVTRTGRAAEPVAPVRNAPPATPRAAAEESSRAPATAASALAAPEPAEIHPLVAVLAGMLLGALLAVAILGRSLLGSMPGRRRPAAAAGAAAGAATKPDIEPAAQDTLRLHREPADPLSYTRAGIDVELTPAADTNVDLDLSNGFTPFDDNSTTSPHPPRISLHDRDNEFANMLDELAATGEVSALYAKPQAEPANNTIRDLFAALEPEADEDDAPTTEMPEQSDQTTAKMPHLSTDELAAQDLQSLSRRLSDEADDERLSATLTQALQLLEKDYEDELSTSQRLSRDDIDDAFARRAGKSG
ncbi:MAG: hypothetical protein V2J12_04395 [Gammaproteobacteria bacterium]|nr:hypothetical protein [Gammaproteobacteria bacterium]